MGRQTGIQGLQEDKTAEQNQRFEREDGTSRDCKNKWNEVKDELTMVSRKRDIKQGRQQGDRVDGSGRRQQKKQRK